MPSPASARAQRIASAENSLIACNGSGGVYYTGWGLGVGGGGEA
jgi:hypothetical protein